MPTEPPRVRLQSVDDFERLASLGKVVIIENATLGMALDGWSCQRMAKEFPKARMRREYDWERNPEDRNLQELGEVSWIASAEDGVDAAARLAQDAAAPPKAPFYWGVREHRGGQVGPASTLKRLRTLLSVPSFLSPKNAPSLFDNAEFWMGAKGTGARAHMDSHCISTLSFVLSGARRWRIGPVPRMPAGAGKSGEDVVFDDGVAYALGWKPMFEFELREGEALLFPPGWIHETLNTHEGCTVALTTQFAEPAPVRYFRNYYNRLRRIGDLQPCWQEMQAYGGKRKWLKLGEEELERQARSSFRESQFHDLDDDGQVTEQEYVEAVKAWANTERAIKKEQVKRPPLPDMRLEPERAEL